MSKDINKMNLDVQKELINIKNHFETKKLEEYNLENIYNSIEDIKINKLLNGIILFISDGPIGNNKNYRLEYYESYIKFIIKILITHPRKYTICKLYIKIKFLEIITKLVKSHQYLKMIEIFLIDNKESYNAKSMLTFTASKGNLLSFLFWNKFFKLDLLDDENICIFEGSIKNSDDRIFKWYINYMKESKTNSYFQKKTVIVNLLNTILSSLIPDKFKLKRIKILSQNCNLIPYFNDMIESKNSISVLYQLMKYYYKIPMETIQLKNISNHFMKDNNIEDKIKMKEIFDLLKTNKEKTILNIVNILTKNCSFINVEDLKLDYNSISENAGIIFDYFNSNLLNTEIVIGIGIGINMLEKKSCDCGKKCFINLIKIFEKTNLFHNLTHHNFFSQMLQIIAPTAQLFTKFYSPIIKINKYSYDSSSSILKNSLAINKILSFLRVCAKKKSKTKIINFKSKYLPLMEELLNFKPKNLPVLKNGSKNWQYQKQKFTNIPPRHLLPYEITIYNNFLLREKADGTLLNNLPLNVFPKTEEIFIRQVKAEYIEDLELYLVFDIDLPNTNILNRYEFLRSIHPYTNNTSIKRIYTNNDLINEIKEERILFKKFLEESKTEKIRWYPKASYLVEDASNDFKEELILDIIDDDKSELTKYINQEGSYTCDGIIISPLLGTCMRDIKIKPKSLMTIDLLYDGTSWIDKDKNKTNIKILLNNMKPKTNKIYRCYPIDKSGDTFEPREIRFDKKYPNSFDIINQILTIYKFDWTKKLLINSPYYQLNSTKPNLNQAYLKELTLQSDILEKQITKMNPDNGKSWLDLGCGKGKLINYIRKYNPKKYVGLDIDTNILLNNIYKMDDFDWIKFTPCNLREDWVNEWYSIQNMKFDYIVMNFSIMHLFDSEKFWTQLKSVCKPTTKIMFNVVSNNLIDKPYKLVDAYMKYENEKVIYCFPWSQLQEISENFITKDKIEEKVRNYNFLIDQIFTSQVDSLISKYDWYHLCMN